ncbi:MAG: hypothetical protein U9R50_03015 [Campylobacterota bacterium]|nr:hypothetical protein [Campylobacterota bacterium]
MKVYKIYFSLSFLLLFNALSIHASNYDEDILEIFSKIAPRLILMSSQKNKIEDEIQICILYEKVDTNAANSLTDKINSNYPNGIKNHKLNIIHSKYSELHKCQNTQLTYLFNTTTKNVIESINYLNQYSILTLSYDPVQLQYGVHASLFLGRKVMPYLNITRIYNDGIKLDNILIRVSKIYTKGEQ